MLTIVGVAFHLLQSMGGDIPQTWREEVVVGYMTRKIPEYLCLLIITFNRDFLQEIPLDPIFLFCSSDSFQTLSSLNIPKCFNIIGEDEFPFQIYWGRRYVREKDTTCLNIGGMIPSPKVLGRTVGVAPSRTSGIAAYASSTEVKHNKDLLYGQRIGTKRG